MTYTVYHNTKSVKDKDLTPFPPVTPFPPEAVGIPDKGRAGRFAIELGCVLDILRDLRKGSPFKGDILIHGAKEALIPGTPPGDAQQEAVSLARRPVGREIIPPVFQSQSADCHMLLNIVPCFRLRKEERN